MFQMLQTMGMTQFPAGAVSGLASWRAVIRPPIDSLPSSYPLKSHPAKTNSSPFNKLHSSQATVREHFNCYILP